MSLIPCPHPAACRVSVGHRPGSADAEQCASIGRGLRAGTGTSAALRTISSVAHDEESPVNLQVPIVIRGAERNMDADEYDQHLREVIDGLADGEDVILSDDAAMTTIVRFATYANQGHGGHSAFLRAESGIVDRDDLLHGVRALRDHPFSLDAEDFDVLEHWVRNRHQPEVPAPTRHQAEQLTWMADRRDLLADLIDRTRKGITSLKDLNMENHLGSSSRLKDKAAGAQQALDVLIEHQSQNGWVPSGINSPLQYLSIKAKGGHKQGIDLVRSYQDDAERSRYGS